MNKRKIPTELLSYIDLVKGLGAVTVKYCCMTSQIPNIRSSPAPTPR